MPLGTMDHRQQSHNCRLVAPNSRFSGMIWAGLWRGALAQARGRLIRRVKSAISVPREDSATSHGRRKAFDIQPDRAIIRIDTYWMSSAGPRAEGIRLVVVADQQSGGWSQTRGWVLCAACSHRRQARRRATRWSFLGRRLSRSVGGTASGEAYPSACVARIAGSHERAPEACPVSLSKR